MEDTQSKDGLTEYKKDILESMEKLKSCDIILSISKITPKKGEATTLKINYNGKRLIPLNNLYKNK